MALQVNYMPPAHSVQVQGFPDLDWLGNVWNNQGRAEAAAAARAPTTGRAGTAMAGAYYDYSAGGWVFPDASPQSQALVPNQGTQMVQQQGGATTPAGMWGRSGGDMLGPLVEDLLEEIGPAMEAFGTLPDFVRRDAAGNYLPPEVLDQNFAEFQRAMALRQQNYQKLNTGLRIGVKILRRLNVRIG